MPRVEADVVGAYLRDSVPMQVAGEDFAHLTVADKRNRRDHVGPGQTYDGTRTSPRIRSRAVRSSAERVTANGPSRAVSSSTVRKPVGCSMSRLKEFLPPIDTVSAAIEPGSTQAVA